MTRGGTAALPPEARAVLAGDRAALARLITRTENDDPTVDPILRALYPRTGRAAVVGLTGPLGVGKSSVLNRLVGHLRTEGVRVGVVAVDPSSPFSGGSILGDRIRLDRAAGDDGVFFRSMAARGHAGGVARATREVVRLLDAFGMQVVFVETVGSGQSDVEVHSVASTSVVIVVPHLGDEVQSMKAGLFEVADVFCVNKSDLPGADVAARYLTELAQLGAHGAAWVPRVVQTSATQGTGIPELWAAVRAHEDYLDAQDLRRSDERRRLSLEIQDLVRERVDRRLSEAWTRDPELRRLLDEVVARREDPHSAADRVVRRTGLRS